jgi:hypothetical protein
LSTIPLVSTKGPNTNSYLSSKIIVHKKDHLWKSRSSFGTRHKNVFGFKMVNGIPAFPLFMIISNDNSIKCKQTIRNLDRFSQPLKKDHILDHKNGHGVSSIYINFL